MSTTISEYFGKNLKSEFLFYLYIVIKVFFEKIRNFLAFFLHFGKYLRNFCEVMLFFFLIWILECLRFPKWYKTWFHDFSIQSYCSFTAAYLFLYTGRLDCCGADRRRHRAGHYFLKNCSTLPGARAFWTLDFRL